MCAGGWVGRGWLGLQTTPPQGTLSNGLMRNLCVAVMLPFESFLCFEMATPPLALRFCITGQVLLKFCPTELVRAALGDGRELRMHMSHTTASILFLDLENFTSLSEATGTPHLVTALSIFFEELSAIICGHDGIIDKYIGDCIMAIWNAPNPTADHEYRACLAALGCMAAVDAREDAYLGLNMRGRIGMETGPVYAGLFGSSYRLSYTAVGNAVNLASRLEGLNKEHYTSILIGPEMELQLAGRLLTRRLNAIAIKGKRQKVVVHELMYPQPVVTDSCSCRLGDFTTESTSP